MGTVKYAGVALVAALLAGCQTTKEPPTTAIVQVEKAPLMVPSVDNIKIQDVEWYVIKKNASANQEGSAEQAFGKSHTDSMLAVSPRGYENLATNQANLVKIIRQYQAQIAAYKDYYGKPATAPADDKKTGADANGKPR
jgi:hypothetical protein